MAERDALVLRDASIPLEGPADVSALARMVGGARYVLLGEATHGSHEFYAARAALTKRLVEEMAFHAVAIEGDWPDARRVHRYVTGGPGDAGAVEALAGFRRFPSWMWRNADVLDFVGWLRGFNDSRPRDARVGFFGLDLYSLYASMEALLRFLQRADPAAAARARERYSCFEAFPDAERYGLSAGLGLEPPCEEQAIAELVELEARALGPEPEGGRDAEEVFSAEQNARVVKNAEQYYRHMFGGLASTWNVRDAHMADTLDALAAYTEKMHGEAKIVVWAHNSHVGDARATDRAAAGEHDLGQLARERHGADVRLVGLTTYEGTVTAARDWGGPAERRTVRPALDGSWEALLHEVGLPAFALETERLASWRNDRRLSRAIGVVYRPQTERLSHYFVTRLPAQFDAIVHVDRTSAVEPLERTSGWEAGEAPETYPFAV